MHLILHVSNAIRLSFEDLDFVDKIRDLAFENDDVAQFFSVLDLPFFESALINFDFFV
jgi:hypothetical protein